MSVPQFAKRDASGFLVRDPLGQFVPEEESAGFVLARALGIDPSAFSLVDGAGGLDGRAERSVRRIVGAAFGARMGRLLARP